MANIFLLSTYEKYKNLDKPLSIKNIFIDKISKFLHNELIKNIKNN